MRVLFVLILALGVYGQTSHKNLTGADIHTPYRWNVADSAARVALSLSAADTAKFLYQRSDNTIWSLKSATGPVWIRTGGSKLDSLTINRWEQVDSGNATKAYKAVRLRGDSAVLPILTGNVITRGTHSVDSLASTKGISATKGNYSGTVLVDSLASTKGISGTYGRFSGPVSGTTGTYSSTVGADSVAVTKGVTVGNNIVGTNAANLGIYTNTADGSDNKSMDLCGGGGSGLSRGAQIILYGNEHATLPGKMRLNAGNGAIVGDISFSTKNTERLRIDSLGRVGIGTSTGAELLTIRGSDTYKLTLSHSSNNMVTSIGNDATKFYLYHNNRAMAGLDSANNFGIGTTSPAARLHISGGLIRGDSLRLANYAAVDSIADVKGMSIGGNIVGTNSSGLNIITNSTDGSDSKYNYITGGGGADNGRGGIIQLFGNEHSSNPGKILINAGNGATVGDIKFYTKATERMRIDSLGNVAIGNTSPSSPLHVTGNIRGDSATIPILTGNVIIRGSLSSDSSISTKSYNAPRGRFDSLVAPIMTGNVITRGRINADTIASSKGISGTYGRFSSIVYGDSIAATKGISGTYGRFSGAVYGTSGTYTSTVTVDSLGSTKGITATTGTFSGALASTTLNTGNGANELYAMDQNVTSTSDPTFDSLRTRVTYSDSGNIPILKSATTIRGTLTVDSLYSATKGIKIGSTVIDTGFYKTWAVPCTLIGVNTTVTNTVEVVKIGSNVTYHVPRMDGTTSGAQVYVKFGSLPSFNVDSAFCPIVGVAPSTNSLLAWIHGNENRSMDILYTNLSYITDIGATFRIHPFSFTVRTY